MPPQLPDPLERRQVLYDPEADPAELIEFGRAYEQAGRFGDALQFYIEAADRPGLERVKARALETADAFLLKGVARAVPELAGEEDWKALAARAEELGKELYAGQARAALEGHLEALEPEEKKGQGKA